MSKLVITVQKDEKNARHELGYYARLGLKEGVPGNIPVDQSFAFDTPAGALQDAANKLSTTFRVGDEIEYDGRLYSDVASAVDAIRSNEGTWR